MHSAGRLDPLTEALLLEVFPCKHGSILLSSQYQQTYTYKNQTSTYFLEIFLCLIPYWSDLHTVKTKVTVCIYEIRFSVTFRQNSVLIQSANNTVWHKKCITECYRNHVRSVTSTQSCICKTRRMSFCPMLDWQKSQTRMLIITCFLHLSLIHIWRCRRSTLCRSRWSPYH